MFKIKKRSREKNLNSISIMIPNLQSYFMEWYNELEEYQKTYCPAFVASYSDQGMIQYIPCR